eukprot:TRINITY_DN65860_c0_g1_i1.p1 TRINITY_DN65860_c0_g1~~TRINITY_DN65860_c0_g1_i1.p1  ORF type:complete len:119 (+),score=1.46 TRINITY_DN65860_c0_g1_i1:841-1197(+)
MEDMLLAKLCTLDKFENNKKIVFDKLQDLDTKVINLDRRGDANKIMEGMKEILKELEAKMYAIDKDGKNLELRVVEVEVKLEKGIVGKEKAENDPLNDPHKICKLEGDLKRLTDEVRS